MLLRDAWKVLMESLFGAYHVYSAGKPCHLRGFATKLFIRSLGVKFLEP